MTLAPHETPGTGPTAAFAERLAAMLPVLETPRTRLRAPRFGDLPAWTEILCDARAVHMGGPYSRADAFLEFAAGLGSWLLRGHGVWTVEPREGGEPLGFVLVGFEPGDREPELGFFLRARAEGNGLAFEAARAARDWAWAQGLSSLVSYVDPANARACALALRLGAHRDPKAEAVIAATDGEPIAVFRHPRPQTRPETRPETGPEARA